VLDKEAGVRVRVGGEVYLLPLELAQGVAVEPLG
jgi:DtxR family Mn-dependent transcriptional regulator